MSKTQHVQRSCDLEKLYRWLSGQLIFISSSEPLQGTCSPYSCQTTESVTNQLALCWLCKLHVWATDGCSSLQTVVVRLTCSCNYISLQLGHTLHIQWFGLPQTIMYHVIFMSNQIHPQYTDTDQPLHWNFPTGNIATYRQYRFLFLLFFFPFCNWYVLITLLKCSQWEKNKMLTFWPFEWYFIANSRSRNVLAVACSQQVLVSLTKCCQSPKLLWFVLLTVVDSPRSFRRFCIWRRYLWKWWAADTHLLQAPQCQLRLTEILRRADRGG